MKIQSVEACQPVAFTSPKDWRTSLGQFLVTITTDDGLTGCGVGGGGLAGVHVVHSLFRDQLVGKTIGNLDDVWDQLKQSLLTVGPEGLGMMALSAVDLALWDLRGHCEQKPVALLLNPECSLDVPLPTYQTVFDELPEDVVQQQGGVKLLMSVGKGSTRSPRECLSGWIETTRQARERIGNDRNLMVDGWMSWDVETTLEFADATADLNLQWIEEPLPLDDHAGYQRLRDECPIPISGGEHIFSLAQFEAVLKVREYQILQPDVCWMGGLTPLIRLVDLANLHSTKIIPHRGSEVWALHAIAALSIEKLAESGRPWMGWVTGQPQIEHGTITIPSRPGLGVKCDPQDSCVEQVLRMP